MYIVPVIGNRTERARYMEVAMKKKVAVFTNGWSDDYLEFALEGIRRRAVKDNIDVFIFLDYTSYDITEDDIKGELNILNLPDLADFDGVLMLGNSLTTAGEINILRDKVLAAKVPAICLEYELDGINCIRTENVNGMKELVEHLITVHGAKDFFWISGPADNEESRARLNAMTEVLENHGLSFDPEKSIDGCWSYAIVEDKLPVVLKSMDKLPDVFVCANDNMALAACVVLDKAGINVPHDVKVTGYDNLVSGNHFSPILTSVDRGWDERSYQAMDSLIELINGAPDFGDRVYDSKLDIGESCGCSMGDVGVKIQKEARRLSLCRSKGLFLTGILSRSTNVLHTLKTLTISTPRSGSCGRKTTPMRVMNSMFVWIRISWSLWIVIHGAVQRVTAIPLMLSTG